MSNTKCSDECTLPAGHPGYHYDERSGMQWVGGPTNCEAGHPKFSLFECTLPAGHPGLHYDDVAGYHWAPSDMRRDGSRPKPREQWTFAGRYTGSDGTPYYVWNLKDERGRLNSSFVYPVALMIGTSWVDAREGE